jgi:tRNA A-37 threonylcarbamoyl transferase component Bud32
VILSGKYEVTEKVGQGGMGIVYRVRHMDLDTVLALKILPRELSQDPDLVERFRREARMMARLNHANIVRVFDFAKDGDTYYLIMEFLKGLNLRQILQERLERSGSSMPLPEVLRVGSQIAEALAYAHGQDPAVVHRDIKPSNIIIEEGTERAVVTDFGIAKLMGQTQSELTHTGLFVGTVKYCAPEQLRHDADIDARVDLYALGMMLYELYTGKQFFAGLKDHEVIGRVLYEKGDNVVELPDTPPEFIALVSRAIARDRDQRHPTAQALLTDMQACLQRVVGGAAPAAEPVGADDIEAQIRALERRRVVRLAEQAREECRQARALAEREGAQNDLAEVFARAVASADEAEQLLEKEQHQDACDRFREAATALTEAAAEAVQQRRRRAVEQAREAARELARQAAERGAAALAAETLAAAEAHVAAAERLATGGELERAAAEFGEAAEAYGSAVVAVERAEELQAIQAELPAVRAARVRAEQAEAPVLAAEAFAGAVRDEERLQAALAAEQLTAARELVTIVQQEFSAAATRAMQAREERATAEARERMEAARDAARRAQAAQLAATELEQAAARDAEGDAAATAGDWEGACHAYDAAVRLYEAARDAALARAEEERAREVLAEAERAAEAARVAAEAAGAAEGAPTLFGRAQSLTARARKRAESGVVAEATSAYRQAAEQYAQAAQLAERRARRAAVEEALAEGAAARTDALEAGANTTAAFAEGERATAEAERLLAADDVTASAASAAAARRAYLEARAEIDRAHRLAEADAALTRADGARAEAVQAGAEEGAADDFREAERLRAEAAALRQQEDWEGVLGQAAAAAERFAASVRVAVEAAGAVAEAAQRAAGAADSRPEDLAAAEGMLAEAQVRQRAGEMVAAAAAYREAALAYRAATERTSAAADEARQGTLAARRAAEEAEAPSRAADEFAQGVRTLTAAESEIAQQHFGAGVRAFRESAHLFEAAASAAARARQHEAVLACRREAEEARAAAEEAKAAELVASDFAHARDELEEGRRALETEDLVNAEAAFRSAAAAFRVTVATSQRLHAEREAQAAQQRARALRATRDPSGLGFFARARVRRAERALTRGRQLLEEEGGDLAEAMRAFEQAAHLLEPLPETLPAGDEATATVIRPVRRVRAVPSVALAAAAVAVLVVGGWALQRALREPVTTADHTAPGSAAENRPAVGPETHEGAGPGDRGGATAEQASGEIAEKRPSGDVRPQEEKRPVEVAAVEAPAVPTVVAEPSPLPPPVIRGVTPEEATVQLAPGDTASFHVEVAQAGDVSYEWTLDGKVVSDAREPTLTVPVTNKKQSVAVVARNQSGEVRHAWQLASLPQPTVVAPTRLLRIVQALPADASLQVGVGEDRRLEVRAESAPEDRLAYAWSVDGRRVGRDAPAFVFTSSAADEAQERRVRVEVTNGAGKTASNEWRISVPAAPVRIVAQQPRGGDVSLAIGAAAALSVEARAGTRDDVPLSYRWSVDGRRVADARGPRLTVPVDGPRSQVEVVVEAPGRQAAVGRWLLRGRAQPTPPPPAAGDPKREIEAWIESYRAAYENKNVDRLVALGVLDANQRDRMRRVLEDLEGLQVRIDAQSIDMQGSDTATVSLTRVDSFSAGGRREQKSIPIRKTLRRRNGTWIAQ